MPDISDLDYPLTKYLLLHAIIGDPGLTKKDGLYRRNFVRLVDKAIREYNITRDCIIAQVEELKKQEEEKTFILFYTFRFSDHFENCINAINRLLKQLDRIKSEPGNCKIPREIRREIEAHSKEIPDIRNSIEHMEDDIKFEKIYGPIISAIDESEEKVIVNSYKISFADIVLTIRGLHKVALDLFPNHN